MVARREHRGRARLGRVSLIQVVCWQIAVVAVLLCVRQPWPTLVGVCAGAAALVALTVVRIEGRWLYERGALTVGYLCRERARDLPDDTGQVPALLDLLVPGCTVRAAPTGAGATMVTSHRGGVTAVLHWQGAAIPAPGALLSLLDGQQATLGIEVVLHAGVRRDGPTKVWLALHAVRGVDLPGDDELTLPLHNAVRRVHRALRRTGVPTEPLDVDAGTALIAGLAHVSGGRNEVREQWRHWRTGGVCQATYTLQGWPELDEERAGRLLTDLFAVPLAVAVTVTASARTGPGGPGTHGVLRLAATTERTVATAQAEMATLAATAGVRLVRLDGSHARGVAASLPIGVFLS